MSYFDEYVEPFEDEAYRDAIAQTAERFERQVFDAFMFDDFKQCLMYGDVQSGKTSHVLGVVGKALDKGFRVVLVLTSDNTRLAQQTFDRVFDAFPDAEVCSKDDEARFRRAIRRDQRRRNLDKPIIVVVTKNVTVLRSWKQIFDATGTLHGQPLLIVDDEADAASLNAKVNKGEVTPVNKELTAIREQSGIGIYLQVTGTPQAIFLQAAVDKWRPDYYIAFSPGEGYIGGKALFEEIPNPHLRSFPNDALSEEIEFTRAAHTYAVTCALLDARGEKACNMLIHPSRQKADHSDAKNEIQAVLNRLRKNFSAEETQESVVTIWEEDLSQTSDFGHTTEEVLEITKAFLDRDPFEYLIVNSEHAVEDDDQLRTGFHVLVGGDSLGRGLTIPALQTVYYSRTTKSPQADTLWQHARMFGYDRILDLLRVFMPGEIAKSFQQVHEGNEAIKSQLENGVDIDSISVELHPRIKPTRATVVNKDYLRPIVGGVNFFASDPENLEFSKLDSLLQRLHSEDLVFVDLRTISQILRHFRADAEDFPVDSFITIIEELSSRNPGDRGALLIRPDRRVRQGTGSLLSPNDRAIGDGIASTPILTLYRIGEELGWQSAPIWVPNIKLPGGNIYYKVS